MNDANFASLSPTLLARKGGAKPAMRPQLGMIPSQAATAEALEDLGWNDMGSEDEQGHEAEILQLTPSPRNDETAAEARELADQANDQLHIPEPEVRKQQALAAERIATHFEHFEADDGDEGAEHEIRDVAAARTSGKRAAFTLRLDPERHLKLRLASTARGRSAQQIVTEALDDLLATMPELESLAAQLKRK